MADTPATLSQHLASQCASVPAAHAPGVAAVIGRIGRIAAVIAQELAHAALRDRLGYVGGVNVSGDEVKKLDVWGHETMLAGLRGTGACAAFVSEEATEPVEIPEAGGAHSVVVCCDPVDGSSNLDVNGSVGTIFSVKAAGTERARRRPPRWAGHRAARRRLRHVRAGDGDGLHGRRRRPRLRAEPRDGRVPPHAPRHPDPPPAGRSTASTRATPAPAPGAARVRRDLRTPDKADGRPYILRYRAPWWPTSTGRSSTGDSSCIPPTTPIPRKPKAKLRLLYEVAPMALIVEQAGGRASTGTRRVLDLEATEYHQRAPIILGARTTSTWPRVPPAGG